ncbi:MAG: PQQ-binding-like beta-propeller repeat protein [Planctomycetaceae bacterium]|nr:PQQ-binding-like beta-propeller repeat protein [Planctomycetaceae bacterium]
MLRCLWMVVACLSTGWAAAGDWPQWRGPDRTDVSTETGLLTSWPEGGPRQVWINKDVGLGYSGVAVVNGVLYTMGAREDQEYLIAVNVADGTEKWSVKMGDRLKNGWGDGPRGTPTVAEDLVYGLSGNGVLVCSQVTTGNIVWQQIMSDFGGKKPNWGYCESVLVDGDKVVCTPGGNKGAVLALDRRTGEPVWQSKDFTDGAQYASIVPIEFEGQPQYLQLTQKTLVGLNPADGSVLWKSEWPGQTAVIPTPIYKDGYVYITSGYGVGCKLVKLIKGADPTDVYFNKNMKNHHGGVILIGDKLYGHSDGGGWTCQDFLTGEVVWNEKGALGKGCLTAADGKLYCLDEKSGAVALVEASPSGWKEQSRFVLEPQTEQRNPQGRIWTHPVIANGKLYLRDQELLLCYDILGR